MRKREENMFILASVRERMAVRDVYMLWLAGNKIEGNLSWQLFLHKMSALFGLGAGVGA